jgi:hypothetical protein
LEFSSESAVGVGTLSLEQAFRYGMGWKSWRKLKLKASLESGVGRRKFKR